MNIISYLYMKYQKIKFFIMVMGMVILTLVFLEVFLRFNHQINVSNLNSLAWEHWSDPDKKKFEERMKAYNRLYDFKNDGFEQKNMLKKAEMKYSEGINNYRIMILGDSVSESTNFIPDLQKKLNTKFFNGKNSLIFNTGTMGYDTKLEWDLLKKYGNVFHPDMIILQFNINDFDGTPILYETDNGSWFAFGRSINTKQISPFLFKHSYIYRSILSLMLAPYESDDDNEILVKNNMKLISEYAKKKNIPLVVIYFPYFSEDQVLVNKYQYLFINLVNSFTNMNVLDLSNVYEKYSLKSICQDTTHPNDLGSQIAASETFTYLTKLKSVIIDNK